MAREQNGRGRNGVHTTSQSSWEFPVTADLPPLKSFGVYLQLEPRTMMPVFCTWVFGYHLKPSFHDAVFAVDLRMSSESAACDLIEWVRKGSMVPLHRHGTGDRGSQLPRCTQPYSESDRPVASGQAAEPFWG